MLTISTKSFAVETATQDAIRKFVNNIGNEIVKTAGNSSLSEDKKRTNILLQKRKSPRISPREQPSHKY